MLNGLQYISVWGNERSSAAFEVINKLCNFEPDAFDRCLTIVLLSF